MKKESPKPNLSLVFFLNGSALNLFGITMISQKPTLAYVFITAGFAFVVAGLLMWRKKKKSQ